LAVGVLGYYYYDASAVATSLYSDAERLREMWATANKTIADLRKEIDDCKAQIKVVEEDRNKLKGDLEAKEKELSDKAEAEKKANEAVATMKTEKEASEKTIKETQEKLDICNKECDAKVKKAQDDCAAKAAVSAAPVVAAV